MHFLHILQQRIAQPRYQFSSPRNCARGWRGCSSARADAIQGDTGKAKAAYQDFLTLWKDADPDIPILIAAKAEYAKLWSFLAEILRSSFASSW